VRYLVTGAAGFIGSHLSEALAAEGHEVVGVDSFTDYYDPELKEQNAAGLDVVRADLAEEPLEGLVGGTDGVFHLAGQPGVRASWGRDFEHYVRRNVLATQRVLESASAASVRVVFASSSSVYGDAERYPTPEDAVPQPRSPYGITKLACEQLVQAYARGGLDAIALRYFTVYGPRQRPDMAFTRMLHALAEGSPFELYGDGSQSRGFTYVADAVAATIRAMEQGRVGAVYNIGGGSEASMLEAIAVAERVSGRTLETRLLPVAAGDVRRTAADTTRIRQALGWAPQVSLEDGLRAQWEWASSKVGAR
jgi:nucleoside-diphosphate-sugar epimerase